MIQKRFIYIHSLHLLHKELFISMYKSSSRIPFRGKSTGSVDRMNVLRDYDHFVKILLIGDSGVGKSCVMMKFTDNNFTCSHVATIGIDFKVKTIEMGKKKIKLQIWDTAGQERFECITNAYYRSVAGVVLMYDITSEASFENIRKWMRNVKTYASYDVDQILVGNKHDLSEERAVSVERATYFANEHGIEFIETSAKEDHNVKIVFAHLTRTIIRRICKDPTFDSINKPPEKTIDLESHPDDGDDEGDSCCSI